MKKIGIPLICGAVVVLFALLAVIMPAATGIVAPILGDIKGFYFIFGHTEKFYTIDVYPGLLVAWIMMLIATLGGILSVLALVLGRDQKVGTFNLSSLIFAGAGLLALIAGILFFCAKSLTGSTDSS